MMVVPSDEGAGVGHLVRVEMAVRHREEGALRWDQGDEGEEDEYAMNHGGLDRTNSKLYCIGEVKLPVICYSLSLIHDVTKMYALSLDNNIH